MALHATAQFFSNGTRSVMLWKHLQVTPLKYYFAGLFISFGVFCMITFMPDKILVFTLLGLAPFIPQMLRGRVKFDFTRPLHAFVCGLMVACLHFTAGVSGPLLNIFFQDIAMTRHEVVATKALSQAVSHVLKFVYFSFIAGSMEAASSVPLWLYAAIVPVAIFGNHLASFILDRMTDKGFYRITQRVLWGLGALYLGRALWMYLMQHPA